MSVIIRLQNLAWSANAHDIREFFKGMSIPEGGVHIVGGEMGDAFIAFASDEDARLAMMKSGESLKAVQVSLQLSSRTQMQKVIETARQQALGVQSYIPPAPAQATTGLQPSTLPSNSSQGAASTPTPSDQNSKQASSMYPNTFNQHYPQMGQYGAYPFPNQITYTPEQQHFMAMGMGQPPMNQMTSQYYAQMYQNQMGRGALPSQVQDQDSFKSQSPVLPNSSVPSSNLVNNSSTSGPSTAKAIDTEEKKNKNPPSQSQQMHQEIQQGKQQYSRTPDRKEGDQKDNRKRHSKSPIRSNSRDRDRRRRHRSRSRSSSRERNSRRRRSRSRERQRDRDRDKERDRRERDTRSRSYRDRNDHHSQDSSEPRSSNKPEKSDVSGGIPGLGEIPDNIPREGLSIYSSIKEEGPQVSQNDAGWPSKDKDDSSPIDTKEFRDRDMTKIFPPIPQPASVPQISLKIPNIPQVSLHQPAISTPQIAPNQVNISATPIPDGVSSVSRQFGVPNLPMNEIKDPRLPVNPPKEAFPPPIPEKDPYYREEKKPRLDEGSREMPPMENNEWPNKRFDNYKSNFNDGWDYPRESDRRPPRQFDERDPGPPAAPEHSYDPRSEDDRFHSGRDSEMSQNRGRGWFSDRGGRGERGGFGRGRGRSSFYDEPGSDRVMEVDTDGYGRGRGVYTDSFDRGGWSRGLSRGRISRSVPYDAKERKKTCCIEILNLPIHATYRNIKEGLRGIYIPHGAIKILTDKHGNRIDVALVKFTKPSDAFEAFKRKQSTFINDVQVDINFIDEVIYDEALDQFDTRSRGPPNQLEQPVSVYLSRLPLGATEKDLVGYLHELSINFRDIAIEYDPVARSVTGGCFLRLTSPEETNVVLRRIPSLPFKGNKLHVEICPDEAMNDYLRKKGRHEGPFPEPGADRREIPYAPFEKEGYWNDMPLSMPGPLGPSQLPMRQGPEPRFRGRNDHFDRIERPREFDNERLFESRGSRWGPLNEDHIPLRFPDDRPSNHLNDRHGPSGQFPQDRYNGPPAHERFDRIGHQTERRDSPDSNNIHKEPPQRPDSNIYISDLPFGSTEQDVERLLSAKSIIATQLVLELEKGSRQPTGGCFIRLETIESSKKAFRSLSNANVEGRRIKVEYSSAERINTAIANKEKLNIFTKKPTIKPTHAVGEATKEEHKPVIKSSQPSKNEDKLSNKDDIKDKKTESAKASNHVAKSQSNSDKKSTETTHHNLVTDSVVLKNISKEVTPTTIKKFFSDDGLIPENIHFNQRNSNGECEVYVTFGLLDHAQEALSKTGQQLGPTNIEVQLISKPIVMAAMGMKFNPQDLFKKKRMSTDKAQNEVQEKKDSPGSPEFRSPLEAKRRGEDRFEEEKNSRQAYNERSPKPIPFTDDHSSSGNRPDLLNFTNENRDHRRNPDPFFTSPTRAGHTPFSDDRDSRRSPTERGPPGMNDPASRTGGRPALPSRGSSAQLGTLVTPDTFGRPGCVLALGNVSYNASTEDIISFFRGFPLTPECVIRRYDERNRPTADARVAFENSHDARKALATLSGRIMKGRPINLSPVN